MVVIYIGRWDLLPKEWDGINGLYEKGEQEIWEEISRQSEAWKASHEYEGTYIGSYTLTWFEEEFNGDNRASLNGTTYFIKIFVDGKSVID